MGRTKMPAKNVTGPLLRRLRSTAGISQDDLAARCQRLGWSIARDTITRIEGGNRLVSDYELLIFAKVLDLPVTCLLPEYPDLTPFLDRGE